MTARRAIIPFLFRQGLCLRHLARVHLDQQEAPAREICGRLLDDAPDEVHPVRAAIERESRLER